MSRRDTIIIAVLVNAALLMILFATAMRSESPKDETKKGKSKHSFAELAKAPNTDVIKHEELLNEFITSVPTVVESGQEPSFLTFSEGRLEEIPMTPIAKEKPAQIKPAEEVKSTVVKTEDLQFVQVTVKKGDFLEKIAKSNNTTIAAIVKANNLASTQLKVGQVLKIPLSEARPLDKRPTTSPSAAPASLSNGEYYIVREGDNPWSIATRNKINLEELLRLNALDEQKAKRLRPGDKLRIR